MPFSIKFLEDQEYEHRGELVANAKIQIGDFSELIQVPVSYWRKKDYLKQWVESISRVVNGDKYQTSALVVSMYEPDTLNFINWWPIYRDDETVYIQNQLLFTDDLKLKFDINNLYSYVGKRDVGTDEEPISEWEIPLQDLRAFLLEIESNSYPVS